MHPIRRTNPQDGFRKGRSPFAGCRGGAPAGSGQRPVTTHAFFAAGKRARAYTKEPQNGFRKGRSPFAGCRDGASAGSGQRPDTLPRVFCRRQKSSCILKGASSQASPFPPRKALLPSTFCLQTFPDILAPRCCRLSFLVVCFQKCILYILKMHFSF